MKIALLNIWILLMLTLFGFLTYTYLIWMEFWKNAFNNHHEFHKKLIKNLLTENSISDESKVSKLELYENLPFLDVGGETSDETILKIKKYKYDLISNLRRSQREFKTKFIDNMMLDHAKRPMFNNNDKANHEDLICLAAHSVKVGSIAKDMMPFKNNSLKDVLPDESFSEHYSKLRYRSCAVVSSSGSLYGSNLGNDIDSHEAVLRFNTAPTEGFEQHVGKKTTFRLVNSQVLTLPSFNFSFDPMYKNVTLIVWDPGQYRHNLDQWYAEPDFDIFTHYKEYRENNMNQPFYILHPQFVWTAWEYVQMTSSFKIPVTPPSSGFLGMLLMMDICPWVHVYEYIPSTRLSERCHYFDSVKDSGCTFGNWHPLAAEKLTTLSMNSASDVDTFVDGKVVIRGMNGNLKCN